MKKTFVFAVMLCLVSMFASTMASAQTLTCTKYASDVTFAIDGDLAEWPASAKVLDGYSLADVGDHSAGPNASDLVFNVHMAWDSTYLYLAYEVTSDATLPLDETEAIGSRYLDDMYRLYLETDTDGTVNDGPDNDEFGIDLRASTTGPLNEVVVISWNSGNFTDPTDTNLNGDANGTMVATTAANGATAYTWEARIAWADVLAHGTANGKALSAPQDGDSWRWDMLLIDDGPVDGQQFNLTTLHAPSGWETINFVDASVVPVTAGVPLIHDGLYAAKLTRTTDGGDAGFDLNDNKVATTGVTTLNFSWWMRSGNETDSTITGFGVAPFDSAQAYLGPTYGEANLVDSNNVVGTDWEFRSVDYTVPGADVAFINLGIRMPAGNSVVIDELKIVDTANPGVNLALNGSFEDWGNGSLVGAAADAVADNGVADSWRFFAVAGGQAVLERVGSSVVTNAQEGQYAAKVTRTADGGDSAFDKDAPGGHMDITGITELKYSFWMRSGSGVPVAVGGQIQPFAAGPAYQPPSVDVVGPLFAEPVPVTWKYYEATYVPDAGVVEVSVRFNTVAPNSFVVDDIKLIDTATGTDIMTNGGLEIWGSGVIVGDAVTPQGVPDNWRMFAVAGAGGMVERLQFQAPAPNAVQLDWTTMQ